MRTMGKIFFLLCLGLSVACSENTSVIIPLGHVAGIETIAYDSHKQHIATGGRKGVVLIWDKKNGRLIKTLAHQKGYIKSLQYSPNGKYFVAGGFDECAFIYGNNYQLLKKINLEQRILGVAFSANSRWSLIWTYKKALLVDMKGEKKEQSLEIPSGQIRQAWISPKGDSIKILASAVYRKGIVLYHKNSQSKGFRVLYSNRSNYGSATFTKNGKKLFLVLYRDVVGSYVSEREFYKTVLLNANNGKKIVSQTILNKRILIGKAVFISNDQQIAIRTVNKNESKIKLLDSNNLKQIKSIPLPARKIFNAPVKMGNSSSIILDDGMNLYEINFKKDSFRMIVKSRRFWITRINNDQHTNKIVLADIAGRGYLFDCVTGKIKTVSTNYLFSTDVGISPDGRWCVLSGKDYKRSSLTPYYLKIINLTTLKVSISKERFSWPISSLQFSNNGKRIIAYNGGHPKKLGFVALYDFNRGKIKKRYFIKNVFSDVRFIDDGKKFMLNGAEIRSYNSVTNIETVKTPCWDISWQKSIAISPEDRLMAIVSPKTNILNIYNLKKRKNITKIFLNKYRAPYQMLFINEKELVCFGPPKYPFMAASNKAYLINIQTAEVKKIDDIRLYDSVSYSINRKAKRVFVVGQDGVIQVFRLPSMKLIGSITLFETDKNRVTWVAKDLNNKFEAPAQAMKLIYQIRDSNIISLSTNSSSYAAGLCRWLLTGKR